jgi:hypothetical protein
MKGLALSRLFYEQIGAPALEARFPGYQDQLAVGLVGEGSECYGFDDEISRDHDWGPGFCLWLTDEVADDIGAEMQAVYNALDPAPLGYGRRNTTAEGAGRVGVLRIGEFYANYTGLNGIPQTLREWRRIPEHFLSVATNGQVFHDGPGRFSAIRANLLGFYPEDLRIKKIAARAAIMAQAGQYNYSRCVKRGEYVAAALALAEFSRATCSMIHLLNKRYTPYYKWMHRNLRELPKLSECYGLLTELHIAGVGLYGRNVERIERICAAIVRELRQQRLTDEDDDFLLAHGSGILSRISDDALLGSHIMAE